VFRCPRTSRSRVCVPFAELVWTATRGDLPRVKELVDSAKINVDSPDEDGACRGPRAKVKRSGSAALTARVQDALASTD